MRHHGRAQDADRDVQFVGILENRRARQKTRQHSARVRLGNQNLEQEATRDRRDERNHQRFEQAKSLVLHVQHDQYVEGGNDDAPWQRNAEQQVQRDRRADDFGEVAGGDRDFADHPQKERHRLGVVIAARLREIAAGYDAKLRGQALQQNRHQIGQQDDRQQRVAEARAASKVGRPIAGIHISDGDEVARPRERECFLPPRAGFDRHGAVHFGETRGEPRVTPTGVNQAIRHRSACRTARARAPGRRHASCRRPASRS